MSSINALLQAKYSPINSRFRVVVAWLLGFALIQPGVTQEVEDQVSDIVSEATEERIEQAMEDLLTDIESRISEDALRIQTDHWLVMAEADVFEQLALEGYLFDRVSELDGLGFLLAEVAAPAMTRWRVRANAEADGADGDATPVAFLESFAKGRVSARVAEALATFLRAEGGHDADFFRFRARFYLRLFARTLETSRDETVLLLRRKNETNVFSTDKKKRRGG